MQEKMILMPQADSTELVRSLAARGQCFAGLRIMNSADLARLALTYSGIALEGRLISTSEQTAIVSDIMKRTAYFQPAAYADAMLLSAALDELRLAADDSVLKEKLLAEDTLFPEKNKALLEVLKEYSAFLADSGLTDRAAVIRQAADRSLPLDAERYSLACIEGCTLKAYEKKLLEKLSGGKAETLTAAQLYGTEEKPLGDIEISSITDAYGASNEAEDIIYTIYQNKLPLDKCTVAVTDPKRMLSSENS